MNGENMKIICLEENYLDSELGRACMPVALEQAPFLGDWGKTVADGHNPDRDRISRRNYRGKCN